ncbi:transposase [Robertmurraya massiliosenegalensis]|uniref:transposase n=1 Tax=Robertmurraya massiliosenegalensis TaxID=1287657 RepID=UPI003D29C6B7
MVENLYSGISRPSIDPVVLFKRIFIQYIFGIRSMRQTIKEKDGYRQYKSNLSICAKCPLLSQCTESKNHQKLIQRHIWEAYLEEAEHLRHNDEIKQIYAKRKETIECVFVFALEKHGMRWTTLRGLKNKSMQAMLTFAAMNLKKMATWTWQPALSESQTS